MMVIVQLPNFPRKGGNPFCIKPQTKSMNCIASEFSKNRRRSLLYQTIDKKYELHDCNIHVHVASKFSEKSGRSLCIKPQMKSMNCMIIAQLPNFQRKVGDPSCIGGKWTKSIDEKYELRRDYSIASEFSERRRQSLLYLTTV